MLLLCAVDLSHYQDSHDSHHEGEARLQEENSLHNKDKMEENTDIQDFPENAYLYENMDVDIIDDEENPKGIIPQMDTSLQETQDDK